MAFSKIPRSFFGVDFAVSAGNLIFGNFSKSTGTSAATFTATPAANVITTLAVHYLKPGDAIQFSGTALVGVTIGTIYFVKTISEVTAGAGFTRLTVAATANGAELTLGAPTGTIGITARGLLYDVTDTEAEPATTGDWRRIVSGFMEMLNRRWNGIPLTDRPAKLTISRTSGVDPTTLEMVLTYTVRVVNAPAPLEVADE